MKVENDYDMKKNQVSKEMRDKFAEVRKLTINKTLEIYLEISFRCIHDDEHVEELKNEYESEESLVTRYRLEISQKCNEEFKKLTNLLNMAKDELNSNHYKEAAMHFKEAATLRKRINDIDIYTKCSEDYDFMSSFFVEYCKSYYFKNKSNILTVSENLTFAFESACLKAIEAHLDLTQLYNDLLLLIAMYDEAMENLANSVVEDISIDKSGNSNSPNAIKQKIKTTAMDEIVDFVKTNTGYIKGKVPVVGDRLEKYVVMYLKSIDLFNLKKYGPTTVAYDPSYKTTLKEGLKEEKKNKREQFKKKIKRLFGFKS